MKKPRPTTTRRPGPFVRLGPDRKRRPHGPRSPKEDRYSPVGKGIHALRCRDLTGPEPFRPLTPISPVCRGAVSPRALGCFPVSQKFGQQDLLWLTIAIWATARRQATSRCRDFSGSVSVISYATPNPSIEQAQVKPRCDAASHPLGDMTLLGVHE